MRGNLAQTVIITSVTRSIPACAGEPNAPETRRLGTGVYPRVCGGTLPLEQLLDPLVGLSPRVRGNLHRAQRPPDNPGSIPACAGEPVPGAIREAVLWVYPRVCGGTASSRKANWSVRGLSPRVRGNPRSKVYCPYRVGSIPACAGEPRWHPPSPARGGVYPRVCGGTIEIIRLGFENQGSIPACAGEPVNRGQVFCHRGVYPRVCGGTGFGGHSLLALLGLSPRVRGNRLRRPLAPCSPGSIPACAGEPIADGDWVIIYEVYPRVCGGTTGRKKENGKEEGLSPRVRGNL